MGLIIYRRRHSDECLEALSKKGVTSKEALENYSGRDCRCAFYIRGVNDYGKVYDRVSLKAYTWEAAQAAAKEYNKSDTVEEIGLSVKDAAERWIAACKVAEKADGTIETYQDITDRLEAFCRQIKVTEIAKVKPNHIDQLRAQWMTTGGRSGNGIKRNTHRNWLGWLATFFTYCHRMGWINEVPTSRVEPVRRKRKRNAEMEIEVEEATLPLDVEGDENYRKLIAAVPEYLAGRIGRKSKATKRTYPFRQRSSPLGSRPDHLVALCELMYNTGLRISDAIFFDVDAMVFEARCAVYTTVQIKTGNDVTVYLPLWLARKLRSLPKVGARYLFLPDPKDWEDYIRNNVNHYLRAAGEAVGIQGVRPHRFRDSFAVNQLNQGRLLEDLQRLLGHASIKTTEKYYSPFVKSRQDRLKQLVTEEWEEDGSAADAAA